MILIKVIVELSLTDVIRFKQKYTQAVIEKLPIKLIVGRTTWYISDEIYKTMRDILNK